MRLGEVASFYHINEQMHHYKHQRTINQSYVIITIVERRRLK
uniref:WD and tetratricopeptide repeats protein 1 n=1 Tax=Rhizophora mucronata TaxID=61149 RepID=A0A2P2M892_RHIMU